MLNCRCKRCCCMNNNYSNRSNCNDFIEDSCNDTCSCNEYNSNCSCGFDDDLQDVFPSNPMLAQSYVPYQFMQDTFKPCTGLECGTIFPELASSYKPLDSMEDIAYIEMTNMPKEGCNS